MRYTELPDGRIRVRVRVREDWPPLEAAYQAEELVLDVAANEAQFRGGPDMEVESTTVRFAAGFGFVGEVVLREV